MSVTRAHVERGFQALDCNCACGEKVEQRQMKRMVSGQSGQRLVQLPVKGMDVVTIRASSDQVNMAPDLLSKLSFESLLRVSALSCSPRKCTMLTTSLSVFDILVRLVEWLAGLREILRAKLLRSPRIVLILLRITLFDHCG